MIRTSVAAAAAVCALSFSVFAQPGPGGMRPGPAKNYICPAQLQVKMVPASPVGGGWMPNEGPFSVQLDPANPPHFSGGNMTCYYKLGGQPGAFMVYQPIGTMKCSVLTNQTGFVCTL